ncbi:Ectopic P granules protein 5 [Homalodisca vitripennis]|nr:Ectopic P granules protein 5 [Homalodisca vitripennis]
MSIATVLCVQSSKITPLLVESQQFAWYLVDCNSSKITPLLVESQQFAWYLVDCNSSKITPLLVESQQFAWYLVDCNSSKITPLLVESQQFAWYLVDCNSSKITPLLVESQQFAWYLVDCNSSKITPLLVESQQFAWYLVDCNSSKITPLLVESQQFAWYLVDCNSYESVTNWFVMSYDPRVILQLTGEDWSNTDMAALDLLEMAAGYSTKVTQFHPSTLRKRQMFVRACVKLILSSLSRHKQLVTTRQDEIRAAVRRMVDKVETVITYSVPGPQKVSEAGLLLTEILALVNQASNSPVGTLAVEALLGWLSSRSTTSVVVAAMLRVLGITVANCFTLGALLEASLSAFFRPGDNPTEVAEHLNNTYFPLVADITLQKSPDPCKSMTLLNSLHTTISPDSHNSERVETIINNIDDNKYVTALFLDCSKAFDCLGHSQISEKLTSLGVFELLHIASGLTNTIRSNPLANHERSPYPDNSLSVLGPVLLILFTDDSLSYTIPLANHERSPSPDNSLSVLGPVLLILFTNDSLSYTIPLANHERSPSPDNSLSVLGPVLLILFTDDSLSYTIPLANHERSPSPDNSLSVLGPVLLILFTDDSLFYTIPLANHESSPSPD